MKRTVSNMMAYLLGFLICVSLLCFVLENVSFDYEYHIRNLDYADIKTELRLGDDEIDIVAREIALYIKGEKDTMQYELPSGKTLFNERELTHMVDVRRLFSFCVFLKFACIGLSLVLGIWLYALNGTYAFRIIAMGLVKVILFVGLFLGIIGFWCYKDFDSFWTVFHRVLFTNDLWLMMPDDALIIFYSSKFFTAVVERIITLFAYTFGGAFALGAIGWVFLPRKKGRTFGKKNTGN